MKALTVKNPWAWAILNAGKDVENRVQPTGYRGILYVHTAKRPDDAGYLDPVYLDTRKRSPEAVYALRDLDLQGYVIGTVDVVGCHPATECKTAEGYCSPWARPGHWHWELANPRPLACPFPEQGQLGIWNLQEKR